MVYNLAANDLRIKICKLILFDSVPLSVFAPPQTMPLKQLYSLIDIQARMALRADATRYFFGYIWWVLEPLMYVAVLYVVFAYILTSRQPDFLMFLMTGKLAFMWFSKTVTQAGISIINGKGLVGRINVPRACFRWR